MKAKIKLLFFICIAVQVIFGYVYCKYVFYQTEIINEASTNDVSIHSLKICILFFIIWILGDYFENYVREIAYSKICIIVKSAYAHKFLHQSEKEFFSTKDWFSYAVKTINTILQQYYYLKMYVLRALVLFIFSLFALLKLSLVCGIAVAAVAMLFSFLIHKLSNKMQILQKKYQDKATKVISMVTDSYKQRDEIHYNQCEIYSITQFDKANNDAENEQKKYNVFQTGFETLNIAQNMAIYITVMMIGCLFAHKGIVGIGIIIAASELSVSVLNNFSIVSKISLKVVGAKKLKKDLWNDLTIKEEFSNKESDLEGDVLVKVQNLSYSYNANQELLKDISLEVHDKEKILIKGESGVGKSTLLNLLIGQINSQEDNISIKCEDYIYVPQIPFVFAGTIRENLTLGKNISEKEIKNVLQLLELNLSMDMMIEQDGNNLSGGQKARIGLARAILFKPRLIIVDEITAELDSELGSRVELLLLNDTEHAVLMVSHRVYHSEKYTRIYELKDKRLEQEV